MAWAERSDDQGVLHKELVGKGVLYAQENRLEPLSHLGCVIKTPQSLGERLTLTLTGPVSLSNGNLYSFEYEVAQL